MKVTGLPRIKAKLLVRGSNPVIFTSRKIGKKRTFPIYKFFDDKNNYIFEVRYGGAKANALQRGMWTHTENAEPFFKELLAGGYKINEPFITLIAKILVSRKGTHEKILQYFFNLSNK